MKRTLIIGAAFMAGLAVQGGAALAANSCKTDGGMRCATTMPVGGYCECTTRGNSQSGTVTAAPARGGKTNSTAGGCGAQPNAPGCR